jgi:23S rRNA (adenine2503-C2)-methyltransferase
MKINLLGKNTQDMESELKSIIEKKYQINQIYDWVYKKNELSPDNFSNLSKTIRKKIKDKFDFAPLKIIEKNQSNDGSIKYLLSLSDEKKIETVFIPQNKRISICLSSQVGCKFGCSFCLTGKMGFIRNLKYYEIVSQLITVLRDNKVKIGERTNLVFMGMGEPFDNYENVIKGIKVIINSKGLSIPPRRITVSTIGLTEKLPDFLNNFSNIKLAISLNSPFPIKRKNIMPIEKTSSIYDILKILKRNARLIKHRVTFEYIMLKGINDSIKDAKELEKITRGIPRKINLIPFNNFEESGLIPTNQKEIDKFAEYLRNFRLVVTIRDSKGKDIKASCGNLFAEDEN